MRRWIVVALFLVGLAALLAFAGWVIFVTQDMGSWTGGSTVLLATIIGAAVFTGGLTGLLMWLAFYSSRKGYDEPFGPDRVGFGPEAETESVPDAGIDREDRRE